MHACCSRGLAPLRAPSSSSPTPDPCARARRPRRVLYPPHQCRRPPAREEPDQAGRCLLLLSALVLLQIFTEETHTCAGQIKHSHKTTFFFDNLCLIFDLGPSAIDFFLFKNKMSWVLTLLYFFCWLADVQGQSPSTASPQSQEGDVPLDTARTWTGEEAWRLQTGTGPSETQWQCVVSWWTQV